MTNNLQIRRSAIVITVITVLLLVAVAIGQAVSSIKIEAESGTLNGNVALNPDSTASGGSSIRFSAATPPPPTGGVDALLRPPAGKILLGSSAPSTGWTGWIAEAGQAPHIWHEYATSGSTFVTDMNNVPDNTIPLINFKPTGGMGLSAYNSILSGAGNAAIDQAANAIIAYGKPMFLAPLHEPENDDDGPGDDEYAAAFRYIVERVRARGADNAIIVWNMMGFGNHGPRYDTLYPGDDVVDWIGTDPYIQTSTTIDTWVELVNNSANGSFPGMYNWAAPKGKPIMFCEFGIGPSVVPVTPTKMFASAEMANLVNNLPLVKALVYWNEQGTQDYRVTHPNWTDGLLSTWVDRSEFQVDISAVAK